ncbi:MAG: excinuclease ABC subunit UvrC [Deltaproteobacteria bacterium]|nr:excinuclease ABC subunit UvrC [Candidatus Anaeroferrophillacea bacterium]
MTTPDNAGLREPVARLPLEPGVYLMKDAAGTIIYIGKAVSLRRRVQSYFSPAPKPAKVTAMVRLVTAVEVVVTPGELDALVLENQLIKQHRPRYNIDLKDDKNYPYVRLDRERPFPRLEVVRRRRPDRAEYFGPYPSAGALRETLAVLQRQFRLRRCRDRQFTNRLRPCLNYQMNLCTGPCCGHIAAADYDRQVEQAALFLHGRGLEVVQRLREAMKERAGAKEYEEAARIRDGIAALERVLSAQQVDRGGEGDLDVLNLAGDDDRGYAAYLLQVRGGMVNGGRPFFFPRFAGSAAELVPALIQEYYGDRQVPPPLIMVPEPFAEQEVVAAWLGGLAGRRVRLQTPRRGHKARLLAMAADNARVHFHQQRDEHRDMDRVLAVLGRKLGLPAAPAIIECIDVSNLGGRAPVASLVAFRNGRPWKEGYRQFNFDDGTGPDDYAIMAATIARRFSSGAMAVDWPDLLLIDGGRGQLAAVVRILEHLGLEVPAAAIAKGRDQRGRKDSRAGDRVFIPGRQNPVALHRHSGVCLLLQQIRDEAHRFAVSRHRQRRRSLTLESELRAIPGIGERRARGLLERFGSVAGVRAAGREELVACPGLDRRTASRVYDYFHVAASEITSTP